MEFLWKKEEWPILSDKQIQNSGVSWVKLVLAFLGHCEIVWVCVDGKKECNRLVLEILSRPSSRREGQGMLPEPWSFHSWAYWPD